MNHNPQEINAMNNNFYRLALAALVTGTVWSLRRQAAARNRQQALRSARPRAEAVQTWEHEGGALPQTGSQMGPNPVLP